MESIQIYDVDKGCFTNVEVDERVAKYIDALEQSNRIIKLQCDTVSQVYLEIQDEIDVMLDFTHDTHLN